MSVFQLRQREEYWGEGEGEGLGGSGQGGTNSFFWGGGDIVEVSWGSISGDFGWAKPKHARHMAELKYGKGVGNV